MVLTLGLFGLAGCAGHDVGSVATVHAVLQKDAPVQIVSVTPKGDNLLATVAIKNTTDRYVQNMMITWTVFRPMNCAASGGAPRLDLAPRICRSAEAKGWRGRARVLKPPWTTGISSLSLSA